MCSHHGKVHTSRVSILLALHVGKHTRYLQRPNAAVLAVLCFGPGGQASLGFTAFCLLTTALQ